MTGIAPKLWVNISNQSGKVIPPRSLVVVTSVSYTDADANTDRQVIHNVEQYDGVKGGNWLITGQAPILSGKKGVAYSDHFLYVATDSSLASPKSGEQWGPQPNKWFLTRGMPGFIAQGAPVSSNQPALFMRYFGDLEVEGRLTSTLAAPSSNNTAAQTATMRIYIPDVTSISTPVGIIASALSDITVVNRDKSMSGISGFFCRAKLANNGNKIEWKITALGCST